MEIPTLVGEFVHLVSLALDHHDGLVDAAGDGELWEHWWTSVPEPGGMRAEIERRLALADENAMMPFTQMSPTGEVLGMTAFYDFDDAVPRREIGYTWLRAGTHGTGVNVEAKKLLLSHAFDEAGCECVGFRTQWVNHRSRQALDRLGAKCDGVLRSHQRHRNGVLRDTVMYSILRHEWPTVHALLEHRLSQR